MKSSQISNSKDSNNQNTQAIQSPSVDQSNMSYSENTSPTNVVIERDHPPANETLEEVIINDPGYNGSVLSSILTICNTIFGSGMLTIPYAMSTIGLANGVIAITIFGCLSFLTLSLLIASAKIMGGRNVSFFSISSRTYPRLSVIFDLAIGIKCFGVSVSYLVIVGELLPKVVIGLFPNISKGSILLTNLFWISACMLIVIPLSFQKSLSSLRYASTISLISVNYILMLVVYFFIKGIRPVQTVDDDGLVSPTFVTTNSTDEQSIPINPTFQYFRWTMDFFRVLPIFVFAYTCHQNIFTVFNEMKITSTETDNRHKKTMISTFVSISIAVFVYISIGIAGYLTFGDSTKSNILSMYPPSNKLVLGGQSLMALMVCICFALQCHPARKSFGNVINYLRTMKRRRGYDNLNELDSPISRNGDGLDDHDHFSEKERSPLLFKTKSQPNLPSITSPLDIKGNEPQQQDNHVNLKFGSSSLNSVASTSSSNYNYNSINDVNNHHDSNSHRHNSNHSIHSNLPLIKDPKIGLSHSLNDLYIIINKNHDYQYQSIDIPSPSPVSPNNTNAIESQSFELSNTLHNTITTCLLLLSYTIACSVKDLGTILSVVGATGSTTIAYILPGLLYYKLNKNERRYQKSSFLMKVALCISVTGVILMINSLFFIFVKI